MEKINVMEGKLEKENDHYVIHVKKGYKISWGSAIPGTLATKTDKLVEIGIRPENLLVSADTSSSHGECILQVMAFENMGNEQLIYLELNGKTLIARRSAQDVVELGEKLLVRFPQEKIIFIDPENGAVFQKS